MTVLSAARNEMCYCPGCSHGGMLEALGAAIDRLGRRPEDICIVSDIGCVGTADRYFHCHTFHGLHGRSITYAEGIKRVRPETLVIVLIGDGGCGIGTGHLVHAARRNADIKVIVFNNFNFGMTGGQHSPTTPPEGITSTTPEGPGDYPFDICKTVMVSGAGHVARCNAFDANCVDRLETALRYPGFSLVDLWELCVAYFVPSNHLNRAGLAQLSEQLGMPFGILHDAPPRAHSAQLLSSNGRAKSPSHARMKATPPIPWDGRREICIAGSAGQRIRSAAGVLGELAVAGGLFAAQQDDFPITVRKGHSVSNLVLATEPIRYPAVEEPELVVILSEEGAARLRLTGLDLSHAAILAEENVALPSGANHCTRFSLKTVEKAAGKNAAALAVLVYGLLIGDWMAPAVLEEVAEASLAGRYREENLAAVRAGMDLFESSRGVAVRARLEQL